MSSGTLTSTNEASTMKQGGKYILNYVTAYDKDMYTNRI